MKTRISTELKAEYIRVVEEIQKEVNPLTDDAAFTVFAFVSSNGYLSIDFPDSRYIKCCGEWEIQSNG